MTNNKFKKYYSKVLPDQKLVEDTKEKMIEEIMKDDIPQKPSIFVLNKYMAFAACVALTVVALLLVHNLQNKVPVTETEMCQTQTGSQSYNNSQTDKIRSDSTAADTKKSTSYHNKDQANKKDSESVVTTAPFYQKSTIADTIENKKTNQTHRHTEAYIPDVIPVTPERSDKITQAQTEAVKETPITAPSAPATNVVTTDINLKPGVTANSKIVVPPPTNPDSEHVKPQYSVITVGENIINLNNSYVYDNNIPAERKEVSVSKADEYFGTEVIPQGLRENYPDTVGWADKYDPDYNSGIGFIFGTESPFYKSNTSFIAMNVAKTDPFYGYSFKCENPVYTEINGCSYNIGIFSDSLSEIYYCRFSKNGICYNLCFKGYSIEKAMQIVFLF